MSTKVTKEGRSPPFADRSVRKGLASSRDYAIEIFHRPNLFRSIAGTEEDAKLQISRVEYNTITRVLEFILVKNHWPMKQKSPLNDDKFLLLSFSLPSSVPPTTGTRLNAVGSRR